MTRAEHLEDSTLAGAAAGPSTRPAPRRSRLEALNVLENPIVIQHARARLRPMPTLSWSLIVLTCVAFIFVLTYYSLTERGAVDPVEAAKAALLPLIVVQGVLLMGLGTSAVATGIARERDQRLLDYHRMSPMRPAAKITGYLFGLPAREYLLFGLTLPFVAYAVLRGGVEVGKVLHFYAVFFSSVWLYHMTGLMAGMVSRKAWQSSFISLGLVAGLYLVLPLFARLGLSFFDFLTVRPTFYGMVAAEVQQGGHGGWAEQRLGLISQYREVPFFGLRLNPTVFSLAVQGFAIAVMYHVVWRKWIDASWHPFSRRFAMLFVAGLMLLLSGSVWPLVADEDAHALLMDRLYSSGSAGVFTLLVGLFAVVCTLTLLLTVSLITANRHTTRRGLRRAWKLGRSRPAWDWDAASSWPATAGMLAMAAAASGVAVAAVRWGGIYSVPPDLWRWLAAMGGLLAAVVIAYQGGFERFGQRAVILSLFVIWVVPVMVMIVMLVAFEDLWRTAMTIGGLCPAVAGACCLAAVLDSLTGHVGHTADLVLRSQEAKEHAHLVIVMCLVIYAALAVLLQVERARFARRLRHQEYAKAQASRPADPPAPAAG